MLRAFQRWLFLEIGTDSEKMDLGWVCLHLLLVFIEMPGPRTLQADA